MNARNWIAALAAALALAACSQKDPANEAIEAAANALNAVYEDAQKYVPDRYAEVKAELDTARKAFDEERYADAIAAVKDVPAMISAMDKKITSQRGKAPKGMTADAWKQTIADYDAARDSWSKAAADMTRATFEASVLAARDAKAKIASIMQSLEVTAS